MKNHNSKLVLMTFATLLFACGEQDLVAPDEALQVTADEEQLATTMLANDDNLVPNGPNTFYQEPWENNYSSSGHAAHPMDYSLSGPNPILNEMGLYSDFVSNVPLDITVNNASYSGWYGNYEYRFTNRSSKSFHLDCTVILFRAPSESSLDHSYWNSVTPFGHPQQDYVEVPIPGTVDSWYIARLVFHDVPKSQRLLYPGESFEYRLGVPLVPNTGYTTIEQSKYTVRVIADLDGSKNEAIIKRYGTQRHTN